MSFKNCRATEEGKEEEEEEEEEEDLKKNIYMTCLRETIN
jgi:hypothetical protein